MLPIRDNVALRHLPLMLWLLIAVNVLVFIHELRLPPGRLDDFIDVYGLVPARLIGGDAADWRPLLSHMFLHGGWMHLIANMWMLQVFGSSVEDRMGPLRFLAFYLLAGGAAAAAQVGFASGSALPMVGASGAIAGVMGAYYAMFPRARVTVMVPIVIIPLLFDVPAVLFLGLWFLSQVFSATASLSARAFEGGVAWWAHAGGFVAGLLLFSLFVQRDRWRRADPGYAAARRSWRRG